MGRAPLEITAGEYKYGKWNWRVEPVLYLETGTNGFFGTNGSRGGPWGQRRGCSVNGPGWWVHGTHAWPVCRIPDWAAQPWTVSFSWISRRTGQTPCSPSPLVRSTNLKAAYPISASSPWSRRGWKPSSAAWPIGQSIMPTLWNPNKNSGYWSLGELPWLAILLCCLKRR